MLGMTAAADVLNHCTFDTRLARWDLEFVLSSMLDARLILYVERRHMTALSKFELAGSSSQGGSRACLCQRSSKEYNILLASSGTVDLPFRRLSFWE